MRVLVVHNFYQQPGGEDAVFHDEVRLLRARGHEVCTFTAHNDDVRGKSRLRLLGETIWNAAAARALGERVREARADVAHFHNTFPLISPAAYSACRRAGAAVVQTLHNYRLICPGALLYRDGQTCEDCVGKSIPLAGAMRGCYRGSRLASTATAFMIASHRAIGTFHRHVDLYLALTDFARQKFIAGGLPEASVQVKPNFLDPDPGPGDGAGGYALFVGRLTEEKGVETLIEAWRQIGTRLPLKVVGDGPLSELVRSAGPGVEALGRQAPDRVLALMGAARCLVFPSRWYEGQPRTIIESLARGTPVLASDLGGTRETAPESLASLRFDPSDPADLARAVRRLIEHPVPASLRQAARQAFVDRFGADVAYPLLIQAYTRALQRRRERSAGDPSLAASPRRVAAD